MTQSDLSCREETRRDDVRAAALFGIDFVEVSDDQLQLEVIFLGKAPTKLEVENVQITGGRRIRDVQVTRVRLQHQSDPTLDDYLEVWVDKPGDFSTYTLSLVQVDDKGQASPMPGFDPLYDSATFSFKASCPTDLDCKTPHTCPPPVRVQPDINYLAKDYASFRQLILDRLALTMPDWQETHVPDLGIALVELLAYAGDYLSYYQDAVATEAYLGTARQRISVRRHARLVDYKMHEGCNSRAWVTLHTDTDGPLPADIFFITSFPNSPAPAALQFADIARVPTSSYVRFEPLLPDGSAPIQVYAEHSEIHFYTWGDSECCISAGATSATLIDKWKTPGGDAGGNQSGNSSGNPSTQPPASSTPAGAATDNQPAASRTQPGSATGKTPSAPPAPERSLNLKPGDVLIFEEVLGPKTGNPADADPRHRQAVRLTKVTPGIDPLYDRSPGGDIPAGQPIVEIEWCSEDALTFTLCISSTGSAPGCAKLDNVSVARGNVILVENRTPATDSLGLVPIESTTENCPTLCTPAETSIIPGRFRPVLSQQPLTFRQPLPSCGCASALLLQDPRNALPVVSLTDHVEQSSRLLSPPAQTNAGSLTPDAAASSNADLTSTWLPVYDLLSSGPGDRHFVVEMDDDGVAHLRFGDGVLGQLPEPGANFTANYSIGNGPDGNVGAETILYLVFPEVTEGLGKIQPRNPFPAAGGTSPEPVEEVKQFAPFVFRDVIERAITADDYATLAADNARRLTERARKHETRSKSDPCQAPFENLQGARATLRWTGSWYEALVAVDPLGTEQADAGLLDQITEYLEPYRRIGHDLGVEAADYVPLDLALRICVKPDFLRGHVEAALLDVFSNRVLANGTLGFFHPDNLTFGQGIYLSRIVAAAQAVTGVQEVDVVRLRRYEVGEPPAGPKPGPFDLPPGSILVLGPFEIARLDNDPSFPENGRLTFLMRGGR